MSGACFAGRGAGHAMPKLGWCLAVVLSWLLMTAECLCQEPVFQPSAEQLAEAGQQLQLLRTELAGLRDRPELQTTQGRQLLADVQVFEKAAAWMLRFSEFPKEPWVGQLQRVLSEGRRRASRLLEGAPDWNLRVGTTIRGYVSGCGRICAAVCIDAARGCGSCHSEAMACSCRAAWSCRSDERGEFH